jgi:trans-2,3-dihydro-3-hydroxyanthranilate isomerase
MTRLLCLQIDAFTRKLYAGNPCMVVLDADGLSEATMHAIALEMNLSETAFVMASQAADLRARYFTPAEEIPLAGHPTIAVIYALIASGRLPMRERFYSIRLELQAGVIEVEVTTSSDGQPLITMSQPSPKFLRSYQPEVVLPAFGLEVRDLMPGYPITTVSTGTPQLMIPLKELQSLRRAQLDFDAYAALKAEGDFFSPHLFVLQSVEGQANTFARHFGLPPDTLEDPFTGSATGGMAAYCWQHGLISTPAFIAQQGHWMGRPGEAYVEVVGPPGAIESVRVGGQAVEVLRGEIKVPEPAQTV